MKFKHSKHTRIEKGKGIEGQLIVFYCSTGAASGTLTATVIAIRFAVKYSPQLLDLKVNTSRVSESVLKLHKYT
ncbi:hypothetical protein KQX54_020878 [Cotesia glomerata]|uniref:Uncharacterized protein n=1 Tax=Cotesia glomerata TaxID=32391 RepID=A0AAV7J946_COTGL|nr:hypothetical protein KQX54_020878 [Cotesia glomerata]